MSQYFLWKEKKSIHFSLTMTIYHMNFMKKCPAVLFDSKNLITYHPIFYMVIADRFILREVETKRNN